MVIRAKISTILSNNEHFSFTFFYRKFIIVFKVKMSTDFLE